MERRSDWRWIPFALSAALLGMGMGCDRPNPARKAAGSPDSSVQPQEPGAEETLAAYLAGSVFRGAAPMSDALEGCVGSGAAGEGESEEGFESDYYLAIARPHVLGVRGSGEEGGMESQDVAAEVIRLAEITRGDSGWVGRVQARPDTLVWTLVQGGPSGAWSVCGPALPGSSERESAYPAFLVTEEFARRGEINGARWSTSAGSWEAVGRLADSVRGATSGVP